jgi:hypothetical protein
VSQNHVPLALGRAWVQSRRAPTLGYALALGRALVPSRRVLALGRALPQTREP